VSILDKILRAVDARIAKLDTHALYEGTVIKQTSDGLLEVKLDDSRFGPGFQHLEIAFGIPGVEVTVAKGMRVAVGFFDGKRDKPIVRHWLSGTPIEVTLDASTTIKFGASALRGVARLGDTAGPYVITSASTKVVAE
jgi:hypothetical protein